MRLDACLLADAAAATQDGKLFIHGGGISRITPPALPWNHPMLAIVLRFEMDDADVGQSFDLSLELRSPTGGNVLPETPKLELRLQRPDTVAGEQAYAQAAVQLAGIPFETAGIYRLHVMLNDDEIAAPPLAVIAPKSLIAAPNRAERRAAKRKA